MVLSSSQIKERIQNPLNKTSIQIALQNEDRVRFHTKPAIKAEFASSYYNTFLKWVSSILPEDQFARFKSLLTFPLVTNEVCDAIFSELNKVFKSGNKRIESTFVRSEYAIEFNSFLDSVKFDEKFELLSKELMRNYINSIIVVDLPEEESLNNKPYFYDVQISAVIDIEVDSDGKILLIIFNDTSGKIISIDTEKYCVFIKQENEVSKETEIVFQSESFHELTFTPACFFWSSYLEKDNKALKQSPINKSLGSFDWFLFFVTARKYLELYASYPITSVLINECDYKNEQGNTCEGGKTKFITTTINGSEKIQTDTYIDCPECKNNKLIGPGSMIGVSVPSKDEPNLLEAVKRLPAERESLDYNQEEEERKKNLLILYNTGIKDSELKQAQNETQIIRGFESSQTILEHIALNIGKTHHFILDTFAKLMYKEYHVSTVVNYGDEFYEISEDSIKEEFTKTQDANLPEYEKDNIKKSYYNQKYKNDPRMISRMKILSDLEPFPNLSIEQVKNIYSENIDANIFSLKINFAKFVSIFESMNGDIVDFGSEIPYHAKIKIIESELLSYGQERKNKSEQS